MRLERVDGTRRHEDPAAAELVIAGCLPLVRKPGTLPTPTAVRYSVGMRPPPTHWPIEVRVEAPPACTRRLRNKGLDLFKEGVHNSLPVRLPLGHLRRLSG